MAISITTDQQASMVAALLRWLQAQRPGERVDLIETHISFVLLAGDRVYKVKKAVNLGFLDFTTPALRRHYCDEELRLNRRTAPELYLDVVPVTGTPERPAFGGDGPVLDWALKMGAFAQDGLWDRLAARGELGPSHVDALAASLNALHDIAAVAGPDDPFGRPAQVRAPMRDNFVALDSLCKSAEDRARVAELDGWEVQAFETLCDIFRQRLRHGRVRECHGDLHLGNVTQVGGRTTMFDCLEFSPDLRWTDVMSDVGFMAMDLHSHGLTRLAHRFVNACLEHSGDHAGLSVLRYYMVHRALVRAKVAALRAAQLYSRAGEQAGRVGDRRAGPVTGAPAVDAGQDVVLHAPHHYLEVARACSRPAAPVLMLTHGFSGSGKTVLTQSLLELCGAIRIRADVERKRLFGLAALARSDATQKPALYSEQATGATQARLREAAALVLGSGYSVILDATFLAHEHRQQARALAERAGVGFVIIDFQAGSQALRERVQRRARRADDASEADLTVLEHQIANAQPLRPDEQDVVVPFDAERPLDDAHMAERWAPLLQRWPQQSQRP